MRVHVTRRRAPTYKPLTLEVWIPAAAGLSGEDVTARVRKLIGGFGLMVFLAAYIWAVTTLGEYIPKHWAFQLAFYGVAGIGWGVPILPLLSWMNRGR